MWNDWKRLCAPTANRRSSIAIKAPSSSTAFTDVLKPEGGVISRDGRGRVFDNIFVERLWRTVKHEDVYWKGYATLGELTVGLAEYFAFYHGERPHQSLGDQTLDVVYRTATGGGAMILDKFGGAGGEPPVERSGTGGSPPAEARSTPESTATAERTHSKTGGSTVPLLVKSNAQLKPN